LWADSLDDFHAALAGSQPVPAAGAAAAVSARLAVAMIIKVLEIAKRRPTLVKDPAEPIDQLIEAARTESAVLAKAADEDGAAFADYLKSVRGKADPPTSQAAMLRAIEVPTTAARSAVRALALARKAVPVIPGFLRSDLGAAALLLSGCLRALLLMIEHNQRYLPAPQPALTTERESLAQEANALSDAVLREIQALD